MGADLIIPQGDKGYDINFTVQDSDGTAYDLTDYTVTLKVWKPGVSGTLIVNAACTVDDASAGTCHYTVVAGTFTSRAKYKLELELTKSGVRESTENYDLQIEESPGST
jgi:hypothetical protein